MAARNLLNLALAAAAITLGLVAYFKPGLEPAPAPQPLTTLLGPDQAIGIHIDRVKHDPLSFIKRGDRWYLMTGERELPASEFQLKALLRLIETTSTTRYAADMVDLESLGLEPPQVTVTIDDVEILFGNTDPLGNRRYALVGATVHLIEDNYQHLVNAGWTNFIERKLVPAGKNIRALQLPDISLTSTDGRHWRISPDKPEVGADAIQQLIDYWSNASALYARRYDGRKSDESVTLEFSDASEALTFNIISHAPEFILARPDQGIQYHLSGSMEATLLTLSETEQDQ